MSEAEAIDTPEKPQGRPEVTFKPIGKEQDFLTPPLSIYQDVKNRPYTVDYLGIKDTWHIYKNSGHGEMVYPHLDKKVGVIEAFIKQEVKNNFLDDSTESSKTVMDLLNKQLNFSTIEDPIKKVGKIYTWIRLNNRSKAIDALKKKLETNPVNEVVDLDRIKIGSLSQYMPRKNG